VTGLRVAVVGAGGVGGYFGARLAEVGADVHFLARGEHLRAIRAAGLDVRSVKGDVMAHVPATDRPDEIGPVDAVLLCVKTYDADAACRAFLRWCRTTRQSCRSSTESDTVDTVVSFAEQLHPDARSSLHDDVVAGRRLELEALHGSVVRRARRHRLDVPANESVYALLQPAARARDRTG
jgi:ketopantoate reductase